MTTRHPMASRVDRALGASADLLRSERRAAPAREAMDAAEEELLARRLLDKWEQADDSRDIYWEDGQLVAAYAVHERCWSVPREARASTHVELAKGLGLL